MGLWDGAVESIRNARVRATVNHSDPWWVELVAILEAPWSVVTCL